jgi:hypothetical protein
MSDPSEPRPGGSPDAEGAADAAARAEQAARQAEQSRADALALTAAAREAAREAARKAGRFSREFVVTVISVVTTAFGVVVALAWNAALSAGLTKWFGVQGRVAALFVYALLITFLAVLGIVIMSRVAKRIDASPVEFKIEGKKE